MVAVFDLDGDYYAVEDICTHDGGILTGGTLQRDEIVCPRHGAHCSIRTGQALTPRANEGSLQVKLRTSLATAMRKPRGAATTARRVWAESAPSRYSS